MAYKHIGVAISGNEEDALLVNKALELARHNDAHLTLIHIDDGLSELYPGIYFPATEDILQLLKNKSDNKLYKLTKNIQWPKTKLRIERGEMPETLLEIMQKEQCDLLVCGHHHSFINRLMPAYRGMINKLSADLLIVPFIDKYPLTSNAPLSYGPVGDVNVSSSAGSPSATVVYRAPSVDCRTASHGWFLYSSAGQPRFPVHHFQLMPVSAR